jgi:hypothetical protein
MAKKKPIAPRIREYQVMNPDASAKEVAAKFKTTAGYVYALRNKDNKDAWKTVSLHTSNKGIGQSITMMEDDITNLTDEQKERLAHNLGRPRMRMQSSTNNPYWENKIQETPADNINHPEHYKAGGIETIDFIEAKQLNYHLGNVVKYITRADHKGNRKEDLLKAQWYLNREIAKL